jgi:hypothetical protein
MHVGTFTFETLLAHEKNFAERSKLFFDCEMNFVFAWANDFLSRRCFSQRFSNFENFRVLGAARTSR